MSDKSSSGGTMGSSGSTSGTSGQTGSSSGSMSGSSSMNERVRVQSIKHIADSCSGGL
jgi:hypothetical protein